MKNGAKEEDEKNVLKEAFPFVNVENQITENKSTENQIVLENDLIAEIQNSEKNDGKISVIDMRTEQVAEQKPEIVAEQKVEEKVSEPVAEPVVEPVAEEKKEETQEPVQEQVEEKV